MLTPTRLFRAAAAALTTLLLSASFVATGITIAPAQTAEAAIPAPVGNTAVINVKVGGARDVATGSVQPLQGVVLKLYEATGTNSSSGSGSLVTSCESDAAGDCSFVVPASALESFSANNDFWVTQSDGSFFPYAAGSDAAEHYLPNSPFVTALDNDDFEATSYRFRINDVARGSTKLSGTDFMTSSSAGSRADSSGVWQSSFQNPAPIAKCGLNIAVLADLSSSITTSALVDLKAAGVNFIEALDGTPSTVSLFTFGTTAPAPNTTGSNNASLLNQSTLVAANVSALKTKINGLAVPGGSYTNWDAGLWQLRNGNYDQVVVITDGNPTAYSTSSTTQGVDTRFNEIERAIFSANTIKAAGTRIVTVGVGSNFGTGQNLRAISGPTEDADYFIGNWDELSDTLGEIARANCEGTVTVVKKVVPWNETGITGAVATGGWTFSAPSVSTGTVAPNSQTATTNNPGQGDHGTINYKLSNIPSGANFTLSEEQQAGFTIVQQGSKNAVCVKNGSTAITVSNVDSLGFSIPVGKSDIVSCTVYNKAPSPTASIIVNKQWVVNGGAAIANGTQPAGLSAQLTIAGANKAWDVAVTGYTVGQTAVLGESMTDTNEYCTITDQKLTSPSTQSLGYTATLGAGTNSFTITNYVECASKLILTKAITGNAQAGGTAASNLWTLNATAQGETTVSGPSGVIGDVTAGVEYTLSESGGPAGYEQQSIECRDGITGPFAAVDGKVTVPALSTYECRFTNAAIAPQLQLRKVVTDDIVDADNWLLTASAGGQAVISGAGTAPYTAVVAGTTYSLAEAAVAPFDDSEFSPSNWVCTTDGGQNVAVTDSTVTLSLAQKVECVITNTADAVDPTFTKTNGAAKANADGTWDVSFTLTVTNPSAILPLTYDLTDSPDLPTGVTGKGATVTLAGNPVGDFSGWTTGSLAIADDAAIAAGAGADVYTVTLTIALPTNTESAALDCGEDGGIDNDATMTPRGGTAITDDECVSIVPPTVTVSKSVTGVNQNADGTWTIVYDVAVTANGEGVVLYDLTDTPQFGAGISIESATATGPGQAAAWNGTSNAVLANAQPIAGGNSNTYVVTVHADVATGVTGTDAADCSLTGQEQGTGFLNVVTLWANGEETVEDACASPLAPEFEKHWSSTKQNADASWDVQFSLEVKNPSATAALYYSLDDEPDFLPGATIESVTVSLNGAAATGWNGTDALATDRKLDQGSTDVYVLVFTVSVPAGVDESVLECSGEPGIGFFNSATVSSGNDSISDDDCGSVEQGVLPLIDKSVSSVEQLADGSWEIEYDIVVSTPETNTLNARYDLADELEFGAGITVLTQAIAGPGSVTTNPAWTGKGANTSVVTDELLPAGTSHTYTVSVTADVAAGVIGTTDADCSLGDGEDGTGFLNSAQLTSGSLVREDTACELPASPSVTKVLVGTPTRGLDGTVTVTYLVTATNDSGVALSYDLTDSIGFADGVNVTGQSVVGPDGVTTRTDWNGTTQDVVVEGQALPADSVHEYTVTVTAKLTLFIFPEDLVCDGTAGSGYFNAAVLTSGNDEFTDDACAPIPTTDLPTLPFDPPTLALTGASVPGPLSLALALLVLGGIFVARRRLVQKPAS